MYSPRVIREDHVRRLYKLKRIKKLPMTKLLAEAIEAYLAENEATQNKKANEKRKGKAQ